MRIFVDADACPVKEEIVEIAAQYDVPVTFIVSTAGYFERGWKAENVLVDALPQAVDIAIINRLEPDDIVVTQDYGLALLTLGKQGKAISPRGYIFTDDNIDRCLLRRQMSAEARKAGVRRRGQRKFSSKHAARFGEKFRSLLV